LSSRRAIRPLPLIALVLTLCACVSRGAPPPANDVVAVRASVHELYRAFGFAPRGEPDWRAMSELFVDGAVFVAPFAAGQTPRAVQEREFFEDFRRFVASDSVRESGLHERILTARIDLYGVVAHAYVSFEGFEPLTGRARTRGLDSIQLLLDRGRWRVVSFTTQYASPAAPLPERFVEPAPAR